MDKIIVKGARENNLKNIDIEIPKNKLVVMTGVSGSGKSSLAFDTIYAEGQRRYQGCGRCPGGRGASAAEGCVLPYSVQQAAPDGRKSARRRSRPPMWRRR